MCSNLSSVFTKARGEGEELVSNILPQGSTGTSKQRALALSSRGLQKEKVLTTKDKSLEGGRNGTHDPCGLYFLRIVCLYLFIYFLSNPVFLYIFVFPNLLSSFIYSTCQRNNLHKSLELTGPPSCLWYLPFACEVYCWAYRRLPEPTCVLSSPHTQVSQVFLWSFLWSLVSIFSTKNAE